MKRHNSLLSDCTQPKQVVVLLHGLFATRRSMGPAGIRLEQAGYLVVNWGYPTFLRSVEQHASALLPTLCALEDDPATESISFMTHSMGGILARYVLQLRNFAKVKRLVMLAPPNGGSHLARISLGPLKRVLPAIAQLSESSDGLPKRLVESRNVEIGIIAASSDFVVRLANTVLPNQRDHCIVKSNHFELPRHAEAITKTIQFLQYGRFEPTQTVRRMAA
jgi:pimeloyl-ACP methyl ester carboxylesterase